MRIVLTVLCLLFSITLTAETIKPFTTDGCSAFPDGTFSQNELWLSCCTAHDFAYWQGGTYAQRLQADKQLRQCVAQVGQQHIAYLMLAGVRVGGSPYLPTSFRWGYGWSYPRWYRPLTAAERKQISTSEITDSKRINKDNK
ncbi:hypothetical protein [Rheinheimera salexigens]|uniref:FAD-binding oxidoreductase n=1 Tax=Rheinheimera salexigens TaxID=1628148 RepID=A0A1E7Q311_9GAMM|nr:hypothetical protein [Rheinheimera salexigens]OEY68510.1 hypothetical protein BI198_02195 [Rheinheimera salexigens]